ncbi:S26 family signal peptidase [Roseofilum casamattae]|uniref:S26 family signal peptidase n=1 Tax=Roseofilum casamattae BLCC-M143 TaxID=3022442 RepID=A0ABT7BSH5_9CYAN|nr:S26 family signal peptidase [Roseofilum casamattae]MDJ1182139.1 S26 family signal peptidase [Roseofilum casamattae BLCC-M143]
MYFVLLFMAAWLRSGISRFSAQTIANVGLETVLRPEETVLTDLVTYRFRPFRRGDVILLEMPELSTIKYIIAQSNETIAIQSGQIFINNRLFDTDSIELPPTFNQPAITLRADEYYAIVTDPDYPGDDVGLVVSRKQIRGQVVFRLYPFHRFGFLD